MIFPFGPFFLQIINNAVGGTGPGVSQKEAGAKWWVVNLIFHDINLKHKLVYCAWYV